jgi:lipopolysaccharide export LptBFGC system permease protein LptF
MSLLVNFKMQKMSERAKLVGLKAFIRRASLKFRAKFYNFLVFPLFVGFFLQIALSLGIHSQKSIRTESSSKIATAFEASGIVTLTFSTFWITIKEWLPLCVSPEVTPGTAVSNPAQKDCKVCYVPVFLTYIFLLAVCFSLRAMRIVEESELGCGALALLYFVFLICCRPYDTAFHNVCVIFNQLTVLSALAWLLAPRFIAIGKPLQQTLIFILFSLLAIVLLSCIIRVVVELRSQRLKTE